MDLIVYFGNITVDYTLCFLIEETSYLYINTVDVQIPKITKEKFDNLTNIELKTLFLKYAYFYTIEQDCIQIITQNREVVIYNSMRNHYDFIDELNERNLYYFKIPKEDLSVVEKYPW